jgi:hypothetical protein
VKAPNAPGPTGDDASREATEAATEAAGMPKDLDEATRSWLHERDRLWRVVGDLDESRRDRLERVARDLAESSRKAQSASYALGHLDGHLDGKREAMREVQRERDGWLRERDDFERRVRDVIAWIQRIAERLDDPSQAAPKPRAPRACGIHGCGHLATIARRLPLWNPSAGRVELWICEPHENFLDRVFGLSRQEQQLLRDMASGEGQMPRHRLLKKLSQWLGGAEEPEGSGNDP